MFSSTSLRQLSKTLRWSKPRVSLVTFTVVRSPQQKSVRHQHVHSAEAEASQKPPLNFNGSSLAEKAKAGPVNLSNPSASVELRPRVVSWSTAASSIEIVFWDSSPKPKQGRSSAEFSNFWLRDHCLCSQCTHPQTKQRQFSTTKMDLNTRIESLVESREGLAIEWANQTHTSFFSWDWLASHRPTSQHHQHHVRYFMNELSRFPSIPYNDIMAADNDGLRAYLRLIKKFGLCFAPGTPTSPEATEALLNRISFIRPTHYGGFWDFTSVANPIDTAYTNLALPAHTDTTYFTDPCGLQLFHMLSHTNGNGGESIFVDGFQAAAYMYRNHQREYELLSLVPIVSHASGSAASAGLITNTARQRGYPVFNHEDFPQPGPKLRKSGQQIAHKEPKPDDLMQIRWNNDDRSPKTNFSSLDTMRGWYEAAQLWASILEMKEFEIEVQLEPGNPVIFDNWRVLHGRRAFTGQRRVCGGYIGMDDYVARLRGFSAGGQNGEDAEEEASD